MDAADGPNGMRRIAIIVKKSRILSTRFTPGPLNDELVTGAGKWNS